MANVIPLRPEASSPAEPQTDDGGRVPFSFDITQPDARGMVHIDACVPLSMAVEFMNLLTTYKPDPPTGDGMA